MEGTLADVLPAIHNIGLHLQKCATSLEHKPHLSKVLQGVEKALEKVDRYYDMMAMSPAYWVAVVCDPRRNMSWVKWVHSDKNICPDAIVNTVRQFFESYRDKSRDAIDDEEEEGAVTFRSWPRTFDQQAG